MNRPPGLHSKEEHHAPLMTHGKCHSQLPRRQVHSHSARLRGPEISHQAAWAPCVRSEADARSRRNRQLALEGSITRFVRYPRRCLLQRHRPLRLRRRRQGII